MKEKIALIGNPNCGKTTLFNKITGANEYVGNRTGVTVSVVSRAIKDSNSILCDLPGIYSLSPYSKEERIAKDFIIENSPSGIINIIDGSNIERNLYLTIQLIQLNFPMIVVVNMADEMKKQGIILDYEELSKDLGVKVMGISAKTGEGMDKLLKNIRHFSPIDFKARSNMENQILKLELSSSITDPEVRLADARYKYIENLVKKHVTKPVKTESFSDKLDKILLNRFTAIPLFLFTMFLIFYLTFGFLGTSLNHLMDCFIDNIIVSPTEWILKIMKADRFIYSLIIEGIIGGIGIVLSFIPQILILFLLLSILEDTGYMTRIAFIMDSPLRKIGLSGKSFIPLVMGFGCTTPAVMAARSLNNYEDRRLTILLTPFMSCGAKLPIYALFTGAFFAENRTLVIFGMYLLGVIIAILTGLILKNTAFKNSDPPFVMELPTYRMPSFKTTMNLIWEKAKGFLIRAGTIIFLMSIIIWMMNHFNFKLQMVNNPKSSILASIGLLIAPLFKPLGFGNWQCAVSLLAGLIAKETVVSSLGVLYGVGEKVIETASISKGLLDVFTPASALSYMVFCLLYVPCVSAYTTICKEIGSKRWAIFSFIMQMGVAYFVAFLVYQTANFIHI